MSHEKLLVRVLKEYMEETLSKGFIRHPSSPARAPALLVKKPKAHFAPIWIARAQRDNDKQLAPITADPGNICPPLERKMVYEISVATAAPPYCKRRGMEISFPDTLWPVQIPGHALQPDYTPSGFQHFMLHQ